MSFSQNVKTELENVMTNARHCQLAELSAINMFCDKELNDKSSVGRKFFTLNKKTSMISRCVNTAIKNSCCRRAFLRGAFLSVGYMSDPNKGYDLEFLVNTKEQANILTDYLSSFNIESKCTKRKGALVLYVKDAEAVVDTLNVMGAHKSVMEIESLRVEKDFRALINRQVNCETANIVKAANAGVKQIKDIRKIEEHMGLDKLPAQLREIAMVRLEHADSSLSELGTYLDPPVGKSGVNHRLRRLSEIADSISD